MGRGIAEGLIAKALNLSNLPRTGKLRIMTIEGQLPIPCGGTHLRDIGEIGSVEALGVELLSWDSGSASK
jgi:Ser-tRNA(Ala) deacylase AlaX